MNLKERGITVGDLLIILVIITITTILVKTIKKDKNTSLIQNNQKEYLIRNQYSQNFM